MTTSNSSSNPSWKPRRGLLIAALITALIGFADAAYLTVQGMTGSVPPCTIGACEQVLTSAYAHLWGIPIALFGALYYGLAVFILALVIFAAKSGLLRWFFWLVAAGFAASLWLIFVQAALLDAFCQYCLLSAATSTILFAIGSKLQRAG